MFALAGVAIGAASANSLPLLNLVAAIVAVVVTHNRMKRRAAKAHGPRSRQPPASRSSPLLTPIGGSSSLPVIGAAVAYALNYSSRRRAHVPTSGVVRSGRL